MNKIIRFLAILICMLAILASCAPRYNKTLKDCSDDNYLYLIAGFDDAAENTDVLFTIGYEKSTNTTKIAQIPRDTYVNFGASQNKINQYFATKRYAGEDKSTAMESTANMIEELFGTKFDGYVGINLSAFKKMVDALGGIDIIVPSDMTVSIDGESPLYLKSGLNHINGADAEKFVRYRSGYVMGDLGRIDAQKMFLNALFGKIMGNMTFPTILKLAGALQNECITNIRLKDITGVLLGAAGAASTRSTFYVTVPGEPAFNSRGVSFYVLNRKSAAEIAKRYMFAKKDFDERRLFLNDDELSFMNIYDDDKFSYRELTPDDITHMHIS